MATVNITAKALQNFMESVQAEGNSAIQMHGYEAAHEDWAKTVLPDALKDAIQESVDNRAIQKFVEVMVEAYIRGIKHTQDCTIGMVFPFMLAFAMGIKFEQFLKEQEELQKLMEKEAI